ncbi:MAG: hypothetical protein JNJ50_11945 [Acidobacteria bacterium]|nr:hypothetical protein [Acidobacteriota bacterium]
MSEEHNRIAHAYRRAGLGLAAAAIFWSAAFIWQGQPGEDRAYWIIPVGAAALSVLCFSLYAKAKDS